MKKEKGGRASRRVAHSGVRLGETRKGKRDVAFLALLACLVPPNDDTRLKSGDTRTEAEATRLKQGVAFNAQREHV